MLDERTYLNIVKIGLADAAGNADAPTIPSHLEHRIGFVNILCQLVDTLGISITTHKGNTGDVAAILLHKIINSIGIQGKPDVLPKVAAVAAWAATGTIRNINRQCHLVGYLLEYDACIDVFKHD